MDNFIGLVYIVPIGYINSQLVVLPKPLKPSTAFPSATGELAGVQGFEPRILESESSVLPVTPYPNIKERASF